MNKPNFSEDSHSLRDTREFIWLSDIHYDAYYGEDSAVGQCKSLSPKYGQRECDSPKDLVQSALSEMTKTLQSTDFVLITGDFLRHETSKLVDSIVETKNMLGDLNELIRSYFPENLSIIPSVGNNDVTPDYYLDINNASETLNTLNEVFLPFLREEEISTFSRGGYLARNVTDLLTILSLNTIVYSSSHKPEPHRTIEDPFGQFQWLRSQLEIARSSKRVVYISGHISPSIGSYRHSQLWRDSYLQRYYLIVNDYTDVIRGQLFGHIHSDEFRLTPSQVPLMLASSLSPIYGSNPSFRRVKYHGLTGEIFDYDAYYLDYNNSQTWKQALSFREAFSLPDMTYDSLHHIVDDFQRLWKTFLLRQHAYNIELVPEACEQQCLIDWKCTLQSISRKRYEDCVDRSDHQGGENESFSLVSRTATFAGIFVASVIFLVTIVFLAKKIVWKRHYRRTIPESDDVQLSLPEFS